MSDDTPDHWNDAQRRVFQRVLRFMSENQPLFMPPSAAQLPADVWQVLSWNCAWMAAEAGDEDTTIVIHDADTDVELAREREVNEQLQ